MLGTDGIKIKNCTIAANSAALLAGGIFAIPGTDISNSIVWQNTVGDTPPTLQSQIDGAEFISFSYSIIQGWQDVNEGQANTGDDPLFQSGLHLLPDSPAIDSGDPDFQAEPGEADLDGMPRVLCGRVDRGAYEFGMVGDVDCDRTVTLADFAQWTSCETGPTDPQPLGDCQALDAHVDGVIDLRDFANLQGEFKAPAE